MKRGRVPTKPWVAALLSAEGGFVHFDHGSDSWLAESEFL